MNRYHEPQFELSAMRILPGEYFVTSQPMLIVTLLGSCVAACLRDRATGMIGMNHFMLPSDRAPRAMQDSGRYGMRAMNLLINAMVHRGADERSLEAKVFGGGIVGATQSFLDVGRHNAEFVIENLKARDIEVVAADLRGLRARKIFFEQSTGTVYVRYVREPIDAEHAS